MTTTTIRRFAGSTRVRVLALFAWLFLALTPAFGMPVTMGGAHDTASVAASGASTAHCHPQPTTAVSSSDHSCCAHHDGCGAEHACGCSTPCNSVVLTPALTHWSRVNPMHARASAHGVHVPAADRAPPLRPPAA